ncbi:flagellar motor protein MotA [Pinisolibacter aquiterrae]|uniref:flagellar motor protein MotA n=1 Tax=Pinisolibacter aquiterrae TaxID=2815579 RepID=UPI001C3CA4E4|nr:flagellar motor protein MotA [Pinisolibacter aquiterrae]MBV5263555.1 flagellar motor protein MotA [Pinisolibacter aquiterrae]MCC8237391.1 flagellar motor protein MotA [Pinisolibacter aquiterrae]
MARDLEHERLSSPQVYLWRMVIFLVIAGFVGVILQRQAITAFHANPGLNGFILFVAALGILLAMRQVVRLFPEVRWVNAFRRGDIDTSTLARPRLLGPMAALIGDRGTTGLTPAVNRSILDSIGMRLDETREITRYIAGTLVFLGLLGTFTGLSETVSSVGDTLKTLNAGASDLGVVFEDLKSGLARPLAGMGIAFSSSLFGLAGSLVIGFLDLQAGAAQNRFYNELEDWLAAETDLEVASPAAGGATESLRASIDRLARAAQDGGGGRNTAAALVDLSESLRELVGQVRSEQAQMRTLIDSQSDEARATRAALERIADGLAPRSRETDER